MPFCPPTSYVQHSVGFSNALILVFHTIIAISHMFLWISHILVIFQLIFELSFFLECVAAGCNGREGGEAA